MYIRKVSQQLYKVVDKRDFFDTELPEELTPEQVNLIGALQANVAALQAYLDTSYSLKRQGASTKEVVIPKCLRQEIEAAVEQQNEPDSEVLSSKKSTTTLSLMEDQSSSSPKTQ